MNDILTRAQLEDAVTTLYKRFQDEPQAFAELGDPRSDALMLVENIFEIANAA